MVSPNNTAIIFIILTAFCWKSSAYSRQNIVIGEVSVGYDFVERKYDENDDEIVTEVTDDETTNRLIISPRISVSSRGINDLLEFTYAPSFPFLTFDDSNNNDSVGHDFNLLGQKSFTKNWSFNVSDNYYYGDDSIEDAALSSSDIIPSTDTEEEQTVGAELTEETSQPLNEKNDGNQYWRNSLNIGTDYTYAQNSVVGLSYSFGVLRNLNGDDGYQEYDRHQGTGSLSYHFNRSWNVDTQVGYVKGIYEPTEITIIQPEIIQVPIEDETVESDADVTDEDEETEIEYEEQTVYNQSEEKSSDDLEEYNFLFRINYDWHTHDRLFTLYSYNATNYESPLREDAAIHDITFGWSHDFSRALQMTLSGGPSFVTFEDSSTDTSYNAYAGLNWNFARNTSLTANSSYGYDFDNFDGDRTGLSQTWRTNLGYSYQFSPRLSFSLSSGYQRSDQEEPIATTVLLDLEGENTADDDVSRYTDETYDAGLALSYNFLRWYSISASYRYAHYQSENDPNYDEHRVYLTLSTSRELFRW